MSIDIRTIPIKFFAKDVIKGQAKKVNDIFTAIMFGTEGQFKVTEIHGDMFFAVIV